MDKIITTLATQAPDLVVLLIVVYKFLGYLEKRDKLYTDLVTQISNELKALSEAFSVHAQETKDAVDEMHRNTHNRRRAQDR